MKSRFARQIHILISISALSITVGFVTDMVVMIIARDIDIKVLCGVGGIAEICLLTALLFIPM